MKKSENTKIIEPTQKKKFNALGCIVIVAVFGLFSWAIGSCLAPVPLITKEMPEEKQKELSEKLFYKAFINATAAFTSSFPKKEIPNNIEVGSYDDCLVTWMPFQGLNVFCVKLAIDSTSKEQRTYIFVDMNYEGSNKWSLIRIRLP